LQQTRDFEGALAQVNAALKLWPENPSLQLQRFGLMYDGLQRREEALRGFQNLFQQTPSPEIKTRCVLAVAGDLQDRSKHDEALKLLRVAYSIAPRYVQGSVLGAMASSYRTQRRFGEALVSMELAALLEGDAEDFTNLAIFYKNADRLDEAIWALRKSIEKNPEDWNTRLILAGYLHRAGKTDEGDEMLKTVEKPRVNHQYYETNMAWFYGSIGRKKKLLEHLGNALKLAKTPGILNYINTEVDFDKFRDDADFKALVEKHKKRLLDEEVRD
jgi:tetratricopeptide (TPR) repeat protein